jgi:hypothetical protein
MKTLTHQQAAERRADRRIAFQIERQDGIPRPETMKLLAKLHREDRNMLKRERKCRGKQPPVLPWQRYMHADVAKYLACLPKHLWRAEMEFALPHMLSLYDLPAVFDPTDRVSWSRWLESILKSLIYRRREARKHRTLPLKLLIHLELSLMFLRDAGSMQTSRLLHTDNQYALFVDSLRQRQSAGKL